jgi:hypothetical protein
MSGRVYMAKYLCRRIIFAQNSKNSLRNINNSPKTIRNKAQAIKLMIPALNITIGYVRQIKFFHNINKTL